MTKIRAYVRIAETGRSRHRITTTIKPSDAPLLDSVGNPLPTIAFSVVFDVDPQAFYAARAVVAEIAVPPQIPTVAMELDRSPDAV